MNSQNKIYNTKCLMCMGAQMLISYSIKNLKYLNYGLVYHH